MTRYSLFVLKVPLNPKQTNKLPQTVLVIYPPSVSECRLETFLFNQALSELAASVSELPTVWRCSNSIIITINCHSLSLVGSAGFESYLATDAINKSVHAVNRSITDTTKNPNATANVKVLVESIQKVG